MNIGSEKQLLCVATHLKGSALQFRNKLVVSKYLTNLHVVNGNYICKSYRQWKKQNSR